MQKRSSKQEPDPNLIAKAVVDQATGTTGQQELTPEQQAARMLGRLGGLKGGRARAVALTKRQRKMIAMNAARARWSRSTQTNESDSA
jgi:hypothetical protein